MEFVAGLPGGSAASTDTWSSPFQAPVAVLVRLPGRTDPTAYAAADTSLTRLYPATVNSVHIRLRASPQ